MYLYYSLLIIIMDKALRYPITTMIDTLKTTVPIGDNGNITNPEHLKIHKVAPGKAKGALLFKNTTNPEDDKVYTQLHFEPFQLGYIDLNTDFDMFKELAEVANGTKNIKEAQAAQAAQAAAQAAGGGPGKYVVDAAKQLQEAASTTDDTDLSDPVKDTIKKNATILYYELINRRKFVPLNLTDAEKISAKKTLDDIRSNIKFLPITTTPNFTIDNGDQYILASGICTSEAQLNGKAFFDFKSPSDCNSNEFKEREAERKIASHAIAMVADKENRSVLENLEITYKGENGQDAYIAKPLGAYNQETIGPILGGEPSHFNNLSPNPHNMSKMIEAPLNAFRGRGRGPNQVFSSAADENKSRRRRNKKARTMKVFGAAKRHRKT